MRRKDTHYTRLQRVPNRENNRSYTISKSLYRINGTFHPNLVGAVS
jgi:hypothetical protein